MKPSDASGNPGTAGPSSSGSATTRSNSRTTLPGLIDDAGPRDGGVGGREHFDPALGEQAGHRLAGAGPKTASGASSGVMMVTATSIFASYARAAVIIASS